MEQITEKLAVSPFGDDPVENIEIAKRIIAGYPNVNLGPLIAVAEDRVQPESARVAAIYALGLTDMGQKSRGLLSRLATDPTEPFVIRDHATEALGTMTPHHLIEPAPLQTLEPRPQAEIPVS